MFNAAGAWAASFPQSGVRLRLTKGMHLVIDRARLPLNDAVVLPVGQRILFAIPWGERVLLGTTDTDFDGDPGDVRAAESDIDHIRNVVDAGFPQAQIRPVDVIAVWAGVRPLIAPSTDKPGAPSDISRRHEVHMTEPGWFGVAGGKLTTCRLMAEQAVNRIGRWMGRPLPPGRTAELPIPGGPASGVLPPPVEASVVRECCGREWAVHLDDVMLRRTSWRLYHANHVTPAGQCAEWMAAALGWNREEVAAELKWYFGTAETVGESPRSRYG